jgi:hypothetical protein
VGHPGDPQSAGGAVCGRHILIEGVPGLGERGFKAAESQD